MHVTAGTLCEMLNGTLEGDSTVLINKPSKIEEGVPGSISFLANPKYQKYAYTTKASVLLVDKDFTPSEPLEPTLIRVDDVYGSITLLLEKFQGTFDIEAGVDEQAKVSTSATIGLGTSVGAFSVVDESVTIGNNCKIFPQVYIAKNVTIGDNVTLHSGVKIYHDCKLGDNVIIHSNTVIGSDGFGFAPQADGSLKKVAQIGNVEIANNVEIGANTVIDRATMGSTKIHQGAKLDNLIQVAHNVEIGENTVVAAQAGIAGSTKLGKNVMVGGQAGFVGHIQIADGTKVQAQSGVAKSIKKPNTAVYGSPAMVYNDFLKSQVLFQKLPELVKKIQELELRISELTTNS